MASPWSTTFVADLRKLEAFPADDDQLAVLIDEVLLSNHRPPKKEHTVTLIRGGDWEGIYFNGELLCENHSLNARDVCEALSCETSIAFHVEFADDDWLDSVGNLPQRLSDVKRFNGAAGI